MKKAYAMNRQITKKLPFPPSMSWIKNISQQRPIPYKASESSMLHCNAQSANIEIQ